MKNFNIVKLDSKGRILVPYHIRDHLGIAEGQELIVSDNDKRELRIFPLMKGSTAMIRVILADKPGVLSKVINVIANNRIDILTSISKTVERGESAEWFAIVDTSQCNGAVRKIEKRLRNMSVVKKVEVEEK